MLCTFNLTNLYWESTKSCLDLKFIFNKSESFPFSLVDQNPYKQNNNTDARIPNSILFFETATENVATYVIHQRNMCQGVS